MYKPRYFLAGLCLLLGGLLLSCSTPPGNLDNGDALVGADASVVSAPTATPTRPDLTPTSPPSPTPTPEPTSPPEPAVDALNYVEIAAATARNAVCNDGTPAGYYYRPSPSGSQTWLIHLEGEGFCYDAASCEARAIDNATATTAIGRPATIVGDGILSFDPARNQLLHDANQVVIPYCSSDLWTGRRVADSETGFRHFQGQTIFRQVIQDLSDASVTGVNPLDSAREVVVTGTQAGGVGVLQHLDWIARQLPQARVGGISDEGWLIDVAPVRTGEPRMLSKLQRAYTLWDAFVEPGCAEANPLREGLCYFGGTVYPHIATPLFIQTSQLPVSWLEEEGFVPPFNRADQEQYALAYARDVVRSLNGVSAYFAPHVAPNGLLTTDEFLSSRIQRQSLQDTLLDWRSGSNAVQLVKPSITADSVRPLLATTGDMVLQLLSPDDAPDAVCNDGTPAGYYYRPASDAAHSDEWVIFLEGGGACYSAASCAERALGSRLTSSQRWNEARNSAGLQSENISSNPAFGGMNQIYIPYCSSDFWTGARPASAATNGWHFQGRAIFDAVIDDLKDSNDQLPALTSAERVLLAGGSAGGMGVMQNLDRLAGALPATAVFGFNDGGFVFDYPPLSAEWVPLHEQFREGTAYVNAQPDASCAEALGELAWQCLDSRTLVPFIETPLFVHMDQYDAALLNALGIGNLAIPQERAAADALAAAIVDNLEPVAAYFSPQRNLHVLSKSTLYNTVTIDGVSLQSALAGWFNGNMEQTTWLSTDGSALPSP